MTKRRIRIQKVSKPQRRDPVAPSLDPRDPEILKAKEHLYATARARRAA